MSDCTVPGFHFTPQALDEVMANERAQAIADCIAAVEALREEYVGDAFAQGELALRVALAALRALGGSDE